MLVTWVIATAASGSTEIGGSRDFGLGVQLGGPSAITGKVYLGGRRNAIDFAVGGGYYGEPNPWYDRFWGQVSYHWHLETLTSGNGVTIPFRVGVGGFVTSAYYGWVGPGAYDAVIGARVPFGLDFDLERAPVQFYIEAAVDVTVLPPLGIGVDGGIGARYYF